MLTEWGSTIENGTSAATFQCLDRSLLIPRDLRQRRNRALGLQGFSTELKYRPKIQGRKSSRIYLPAVHETSKEEYLLLEKLFLWH